MTGRLGTYQLIIMQLETIIGIACSEGATVTRRRRKKPEICTWIEISPKRDWVEKFAHKKSLN